MGIKAHYAVSWWKVTESLPVSQNIASMAKGRFYRLLDELSQCITTGADIQGARLMYPEKMQRRYQIEDKQLINRLRQADGGMCIAGW